VVGDAVLFYRLFFLYLRSSFLRAVRKKGVYMIDRFIWEIAGVLFVATFAVTLTLLS
jgi:hypothetical protein